MNFTDQLATSISSGNVALWAMVTNVASIQVNKWWHVYTHAHTAGCQHLALTGDTRHEFDRSAGEVASLQRMSRHLTPNVRIGACMCVWKYYQSTIRHEIYTPDGIILPTFRFLFPLL